MTDITDAQFADFPNRSGQTTFSYAQLLAQLAIDIPSGAGGPFAGLGARVTRSPTETIPEGFPGTVIIFTSFPNPEYDDLAFYDGTTGLVIPITSPPIQRVQLIGHTTWSGNAAGQYNQFILKNGGAIGDGRQSVQRGTPNTQYLNSVSGPIDVVAGDKLELLALQFSSPPGSRTLSFAQFTLLVTK